MANTKADFATFIANNLRALPRIYNNITVPGICHITVTNWLNSKRFNGSVPNAYSLHKLAVNTGQVFFIRSDKIWAEKTQPTYRPVSKAVIISQRIEACIQAYERWPGNSPPKYMELHVPNYSTIARIANPFTLTTFICDQHGIRFEGWDNYPVLRQYPRPPQIPPRATDCGSYAEHVNVPANPATLIVPNSFGISITIVSGCL